MSGGRGAVLAVALGCALAGCGGDDPAPPPREAPVRPAAAAAALADSLRAGGLAARAGEPVTQPFIPVPGQLVEVRGEYVQVYTLGSSGAVDEVLRRDLAAVDWIGTPHFFRRGELLVLYVGESAGVLEALRRELGPEARRS